MQFVCARPQFGNGAAGEQVAGRRLLSTCSTGTAGTCLLGVTGVGEPTFHLFALIAKLVCVPASVSNASVCRFHASLLL